jgi:phosphorylcholine metabolism protein LicD
MKTPVFPYQNVQAYLDAIGVLEKGTVEEIETARKVFRKLYLQHYQKHRYQKTHSNISISLSKKEKVQLEKLAIQQGTKLASFLKDIVLGYANADVADQIKITTSENTIELKRLFSLCYDVVEELHFENTNAELTPTYEELLQFFKQLETLLKEEN